MSESLTLLTLESILVAGGIPFETWEKTPGARTTADLLAENLERECEIRIVGGMIFRVTKIIKMYLLDGGNPKRGHLIEEFEIKNGKRQDRNRHPSGKVGRGESIEEAFEREMKHELGLELKDRIRHGNATITNEVCDSKSYPGLPTMYEIHHIGATLKAGTPPTLKDTFVFNEPDGTEIHFRWPPFHD